MTRAIAAAVIAAACVAGCSKDAARVQVGRSVYAGAVSELVGAPGGAHVAALAGAKPSGEANAPEDLRLGALVVAPVAGGAARTVGQGVSNLPGSLAFSPDGAWLAFLGNYSVPKRSGELMLARCAGGDAAPVADRVTYYAFSPGAEVLAYVSDGTLFVKPLAGGDAVKVTTGVSLVEFGPKGTPEALRLLVKRNVANGGALLAYDVATKQLTAYARLAGMFARSDDGAALAFRAGGLLPASATAPESLLGGAKKVGDSEPGLYLVAGGAAPRRVSEIETGDFKFSRDGRRLAYLTLALGEAQAGDLWLVEGDAKARKIAGRVSRFLFAPDGTLVLLGAFDSRSGAGTLGMVPPSGELVEVARNVLALALSTKGQHLLFSQQVLAHQYYSLALVAQRVDSPRKKPQIVQSGVFGFTVDADDRLLAYKARCLDFGKVKGVKTSAMVPCSLFVEELGAIDARPEPARGAAVEATIPAPPAASASRVAAFEWLKGRDELLLVTSRLEGRNSESTKFMLAVTKGAAGARPRMIDDDVTGEYAVLGERVAYVVGEAGREGIYVAEIGKAGGAE